MITFIFDNNIKMPMYEQLYRFIRVEIENGRLHSDEKMPSKRKLAIHLKISTITVETAYAQLVAEGYLRAVQKSGYFVQSYESNLLNVEPFIPETPVIYNESQEKYDYDFKTNVVGTNLFPFTTWAKLAREVLSESRNELLNITHPQGSFLLRKEIADYLYNFRGVKANTEQIVVGAGSEYLMGLIIQLLGRKNIYAVENPGYSKIYKIFQSNDVTTVPVSLDEQGLSVNKLRKTKANVVHVTPSHQFPLGIIMPISRRISLLNWASESSDRYILEDDYDSEFRFAGHPIPALQGLDFLGKVIYINAFTKSLAPSLRISYIVLPPQLLEVYQKRFMFYSCTVPNFEQYILSKFMCKGYFERHLNRMRNAYKERRDLFINAISRSNLADSIDIIGQDAGLHLLMQIKNGLNETQLVNRAKDASVRVYGLSEYYNSVIQNFPKSTVVIGYSGLQPSQIDEAVKRLEKAWKI
ncbi:MAG: GntR family transcriptional regulator [Clostridiales bacterium GWF2_38_85]|nr:MAG: GntR family transcriptional regulator [Clostridiales bacterium GWF2_38_85]HBL84993.1 GntR family transcriptional regulator [Clostridiales bacterium]